MNGPRGPLILRRCKIHFNLNTRIRSYNQEQLQKKSIGPYEFTDFQHFSVFDTEVPKTILATKLPICTGDNTMADTLYEPCNKTQTHTERPLTRLDKYRGFLRNDTSKQKNIGFANPTTMHFFLKKVPHVNDPRGPLILRRCKFIFQIDHTNCQRQLKEIAKQIRWTKRNSDFEYFSVFGFELTKTIFVITWTNHTEHNLTLWQKRPTSHVIWGKRAMSGLPGRPGKTYGSVRKQCV